MIFIAEPDFLTSPDNFTVPAFSIRIGPQTFLKKEAVIVPEGPLNGILQAPSHLATARRSKENGPIAVTDCPSTSGELPPDLGAGAARAAEIDADTAGELIRTGRGAGATALVTGIIALETERPLVTGWRASLGGVEGRVEGTGAWRTIGFITGV